MAGITIELNKNKRNNAGACQASVISIHQVEITTLAKTVLRQKFIDNDINNNHMQNSLTPQFFL